MDKISMTLSNVDGDGLFNFDASNDDRVNFDGYNDGCVNFDGSNDEEHVSNTDSPTQFNFFRLVKKKNV